MMRVQIFCFVPRRLVAGQHGITSITRRCLVTYAEDREKWQADPAVMMYGQLLDMRNEQPDAFVIAGDSLRRNKHLPADLRASVSRTVASVLLQSAVGRSEGWKENHSAAWPEELYDEAIEAASLACEAYDEAITESADPDLCAAIAPHVPEWDKAITASKTLSVSARKLRAELRLQEIRWHARQADHARIIGEAASRGDEADINCDLAGDALEAAGLPKTIKEKDLLKRAASAAEKMIEECATSTHIEGSDGEKVLVQFRSQGQLMLSILLKNMSISYAIAQNNKKCFKAMQRALTVRVEDPSMMSDASAQQIHAAAKGVLELCARNVESSDKDWATVSASKEAVEIAELLMEFDAWNKERSEAKSE